jgi:hypothetical protein
MGFGPAQQRQADDCRNQPNNDPNYTLKAAREVWQFVKLQRVVGGENAVDASCPLSAWLALGLSLEVPIHQSFKVPLANLNP